MKGEGEGEGEEFCAEEVELNLAPTGICMHNFAVFFSPYADNCAYRQKKFCGKKNPQNGKNGNNDFKKQRFCKCSNYFNIQPVITVFYLFISLRTFYYYKVSI